MAIPFPPERFTPKTGDESDPYDESGQFARRAAYERAHKLLNLHELGYAVREYCMPEDEFRFVWHGKRYLTSSKGQQFTDIVIVQGEVCIQYVVLRNCGELA